MELRERRGVRVRRALARRFGRLFFGCVLLVCRHGLWRIGDVGGLRRVHTRSREGRRAVVAPTGCRTAGSSSSSVQAAKPETARTTPRTPNLSDRSLTMWTLPGALKFDGHPARTSIPQPATVRQQVQGPRRLRLSACLSKGPAALAEAWGEKVGVSRSKPSEAGGESRGAYDRTRARSTPGSRRDRPKDTGLLGALSQVRATTGARMRCHRAAQ